VIRAVIPSGFNIVPENSGPGIFVLHSPWS
jgi:hypothetical protein